jgi:hypothetical protein
MSEMQNPEDRPTALQRSRRNLIKIAAVAGTAVVAKTQTASANCGNDKDVGKGCSGADCFLRGTTIRTANGDRKVEDLVAGDLLPTVFGGMQPIQWIGRYRFTKTDPSKAWAKDVAPVRIARSALGPDLPHADLFVTRTHALLIDDVLVPVCNLINGTTITLHDARELEELEFFHIKLARHDVIHAEGIPCRSQSHQRRRVSAGIRRPDRRERSVCAGAWLRRSCRNQVAFPQRAVALVRPPPAARHHSRQAGRRRNTSD